MIKPRNRRTTMPLSVVVYPWMGKSANRSVLICGNCFLQKDLWYLEKLTKMANSEGSMFWLVNRGLSNSTVQLTVCSSYSATNYIYLILPFLELDTAPRRPLQERKIPAMPAVGSPLIEIPASQANTTFPPPPNHYAQAVPALSSSPSSTASRAATNALNRALSLASKKLFGATVRGSPPVKDRSTPSSPRRPQIITLDPEGERDPLEDQILGDLEDLAQKTDVLTHWADEMFEYVKAVPQSTLYRYPRDRLSRANPVLNQNHLPILHSSPNGMGKRISRLDVGGMLIPRQSIML